MTIRILLVDDQALFRGALRMLMATLKDLEVIAEAEDGDEAVRLADTLSPDIVVMDLSLPTVDGFEATRQIRQAHPEMPVVLLSGYADKGARDQAARVGAACVLEKSALDKLLPAIKAAVAAPA